MAYPHPKCPRVLPRDAMQARPMPSCGVCPSVRLPVTFVDSVERNIRIFEFFSPSGSHAILVFSVPNVAIFLMGASNAGGVGKNCDSQRIPGCRIDDCCSANNNCDGDRAVYRTDGDASVNLCLSETVWMTMTKRREQNLIVRSGNFEAELALDVLYY